jgi:myo-inositol 2-dehydrogenase / D-chiro-inositol 1-dehydrogenase
MINIAVVGAGRMAVVRSLAFLAVSSNCRISIVAAKHLDRAQALADRLGCSRYTDDYHEILYENPDAVLIETPHLIQDHVTCWALESGLHVMIGGCLATRSHVGLKIIRLATEHSLIVETGYESRYKDVWHIAESEIRSGKIGRVIAVRGTALFNADPDSWYYAETQSGGMIPTHLTYAFLNPIRTILGIPISVHGFANSKRTTGVNKVLHETCVVNLLFEDNVIGTLTGGYVKPLALEAWDVLFIGTDGYLEVKPGDLEPGSLIMQTASGETVSRSFSVNHAFVRQAQAFLDAISTGSGNVLNPPEDSLLDLIVAEAVVESIQSGTIVRPQPPIILPYDH